MSRRFAVLSAVALVAALAARGQAHAHRLEAEAQTRTVRKIQVEGWFDNGKAPEAAKVEVFRGDGQLLTEGRLDRDGTFVFFAGGEALRVVVSAGEGHVREITIPAVDLGQPGGTDTTPGLPRTDQRNPDAVKDILIGVGFVLGAAAFALSLWNARQIRKARGS